MKEARGVYATKVAEDNEVGDEIQVITLVL